MFDIKPSGQIPALAGTRGRGETAASDEGQPQRAADATPRSHPVRRRVPALS